MRVCVLLENQLPRRKQATAAGSHNPLFPNSETRESSFTPLFPSFHHPPPHSPWSVHPICSAQGDCPVSPASRGSQALIRTE